MIGCSSRLEYMSISLIICLVVSLTYGCRPRAQSILDRWQTGNSIFQIRISEYQEKHFPISKFCYVLESTHRTSADWHPIITSCTDDDMPIPRDRVHFLSDRAAYVSMMDKYAVTMNGGDSWSVWDVVQATDDRQSSQLFIKEVHVNTNGSGTLTLASRSDALPTTELSTNDFGLTWNSK
jgi:hypothetical protein